MSNKMSNNIDNKFHCIICNFKCCYKSNYEQHLITPKHKKNADGINNDKNGIKKGINGIKKDINGINEFTNVCECGKQYRFQSGLSRHKQKCNVTNQPNIIVTQDTVENVYNKEKESLILTLITQNKELMNLLASQQQEHKEETKELLNTIQEIVPKIGNNNNNITNNNKFNLQVFLNEDCKDAINFSEFIESIHVSIEDLENQSQLGYVDGISKIFLDNMKELGTLKRPLHCTDKKRNTLYIKENDEWDKEGSQEHLLHGIKVITGRTHQTLCDMKEENPGEYSDMDSDFSNKCINIQRSLLPGFPRETTFGKVIGSISDGSVVDKDT